MDASNSPSAQTLGQITLIQSMIAQLPDKENMMKFLCQGLKDMPGIRSINYELIEDEIFPGTPSKPITKTLNVFVLKSEHYLHGTISLDIFDPPAFAPYSPFIKNLFNMLVVIFEEKRQRQLNASILEDLENRIFTRTIELEKEISERKLFEVALQEEKERALQYLQNIEVILVVLDDKAQVSLINRKGCQTLGYEEEELIGQNWFQICLPSDEFKTVFHAYQQIVQGQIANFEYFENHILTKSGEKRFIAWHSTSLEDENGNFLRVISSGEDITEKRKAELALKESEENLSITLNSIGDAVISTDKHCKVTRLNKVAEELTGWKQAEATGQALEKVFHIINAHSRKLVENPAKKVLETGRIIGLANHTVLISKNGREYQISDSGAPIRDGEGHITGVVLVFRDVTEEYRLEKELMKMEKLESIGVLAGGIAHDFNNLLTSIFGNLEMAKISIEKSHNAYQYLELAQTSMESATHLTKQLLTFAKGGEPIKESISLIELIKQSAQFSLRGSKVKLNLSLPESLWNVHADKGQLSQVISNLVINAEQAMPLGGSLNIRAFNKEQEHKKFVILEVADTGMGISPEHLQKIFDPYFTTKKQGNGLGLATIHSIITKHKGTIQAKSIVGSGTTFTIQLAAEEKANETMSSTLSETPINRDQCYNVLILDDDEMICTVLKAMLKKLGHKSVISHNGFDAISSYKKAFESGTGFDFMISDLTIPGGMGGQEAAQQILKIDPKAKIVVSSGYATDPIMANFTKYGFCGIITKPYRIKNLEELIQQVFS